MTSTSKYIVAALVVGAIIGAFCVRLFSGTSVTNQVAAASPAGTTFSNAKFYGVVVNLASPGTNGTSTSIINTDANDRYITAVKIGCENVGTTTRTAYTGTGLASLILSVGTTTTPNPTSFSSIFPITTNFVIGTSTVGLMTASSTSSLASTTNAAIWPSLTPLTFSFNATNTAVCTVGVDAFAS